MNGEPPPIEHGLPARLVVPGLYGFVSAKVGGRPGVDPVRQDRGVLDQLGWSDRADQDRVRIDVPKDGQKIGQWAVTFGGVAWAQNRGIKAVEVQIDDGPLAARPTRGRPTPGHLAVVVFPWRDATRSAHHHSAPPTRPARSRPATRTRPSRTVPRATRSRSTSSDAAADHVVVTSTGRRVRPRRGWPKTARIAELLTAADPRGRRRRPGSPGNCPSARSVSAGRRAHAARRRRTVERGGRRCGVQRDRCGRGRAAGPARGS